MKNFATFKDAYSAASTFFDNNNLSFGHTKVLDRENPDGPMLKITEFFAKDDSGVILSADTFDCVIEDYQS